MQFLLHSQNIYMIMMSELLKTIRKKLHFYVDLVYGLLSVICYLLLNNNQIQKREIVQYNKHSVKQKMSEWLRDCHCQ